MALISLRQLLDHAAENDYGVPAFNVNNLFFFEIYDETIRDYRQFYSLLYEVGYNYNVPVLFEMMIEGKLSLLLRERIVAETTQSYFPSY